MIENVNTSNKYKDYLNQNLIILILVLVTVYSCSKPTELQQDFNCNTINLGKSSVIQDFQKKFAVTIPDTWSKKMFYNEYQTSLMAADSLKPLKESFILDISLNNGDLKVDETIKNTIIRNIISKEHLRINKFKIGKFHSKPSVWLLAEGTRNEMPFHLFKLLSKRDANTYYQIETQIYGDSLVNERVCKAISLIETLTDLNKK
ncbi:MAG TPA: hypothetical protein ENK67_06400 [Flavobacteriia bacterium]|nr:hypothetical protein [Flavobacteriia bacterium]